ncbi:MAG TPA: hypothetical protein ENJ01_10575 [Gammaproteobacteria bacterium]|nr:hypothetical protein [Gammaproteobacteria bacterium]
MKARLYLGYILSGLGMGYILTMMGFADYDEVFNMFAFRDFRLTFSFLGSVAILALFSFAMIKVYPLQKKIFHPGLVTGSIVFGTGWAMTGACPSIVLVQLGQGKVAALFTIIGIILGVKLYWWLHARYFRWSTGSCGI